MKIIIIGIIIISILIIIGCSTNYQCYDGSFVDSPNLCSLRIYPEKECPKLDYPEYPIKIETKTITEKIFLCKDGTTQVRNINDCPQPNIPINITINSNKRLNIMGVATAEYNTFRPSNGNEFLVLDLTVFNLNIDLLGISPIEFFVKDSEGYSYRSSDTTYLFEDSIKSLTLSKGDKIRGRISFEVKKDANVKEIILKTLTGQYSFDTDI